MECLCEDTEFFLNDGSVKKIQDLDAGDHLNGINEPCIVLTTTKLEDELLMVSYSDEHFICNSDNILILKNDIKIQDVAGSVENFGVSFFCPATLRYKYQICKTLRAAVLVKNFLNDIIDIVDITVSDYFTSDCKLSLYAKYYIQDYLVSKLPFKITYSHRGICYRLQFKNNAQRLRRNKMQFKNVL